MSGFTDWWVNQQLQEIVDGSWISLHYDSPELDGLGGSEISGGGYARYKMIWSEPTNRIIWSVDNATFTGLISTQVSHFGVWNAATQGNMFAFGRVPGTKPALILQGQGYSLRAGDIAISYA